MIRRYLMGSISHINKSIHRTTDKPSLIKCITERAIHSESGAYDGDGKTTVKILNNDQDIFLVNTYSAGGFRLSNNMFIHGSILIFPTHIFSWNVNRSQDINLDSIKVLDLIVPKTRVLILGYGSEYNEYDSSLPMKLKKRGITCEMLPTKNAIATYNYLAADSVVVAGAFLPVHDVTKMTARDLGQLYEKENLFGTKDYLPDSTRVEQRMDRYDPYIKKD